MLWEGTYSRMGHITLPVIVTTVIVWDYFLTTTAAVEACAFDTCAWAQDHCQNGGSCSLDKVSCAAVCACVPGFRGERCESAVAEDPDSVILTTTSKPTSTITKTEPSRCVFNPCSSFEYCLNNGTCSFDEATCLARCECRHGFTGSRCEANHGTAVISKTKTTTTTTMKVVQTCVFNTCLFIDTCQNNGTCILNDKTCTVSCACPGGYTGSRCENINSDVNVTTATTNTTLCTFDPCMAMSGFCLNDGACSIDRITCIAQCACSRGFTGDRCESKENTTRSTTNLPITTKAKRTCAFDPCVWSTNYCKNGGKCKLNENTCLAFCTCSTGFTGDRCENVAGTGATTSVPATTSERICAFDICAWSTSYCNNGGKCFLDKRTCMAKCKCPDNFSGTRCKDKSETTTKDPDGNTSSCLENPCETEDFCLQDAECVYDERNCTSRCKCPDGYGGTRCETETERTTQGIITVVTASESLSQAYNVCRDGALERTEQERVCEPTGALKCVFGTCKVTLQTEGRFTGYKYKCECDPGAQGKYYTVPSKSLATISKFAKDHWHVN